MARIIYNLSISNVTNNSFQITYGNWGETKSSGNSFLFKIIDENDILIKLYNYKGDEYHKCYDIKWFNHPSYGTMSGQIYEYMLTNKMSELCT